MCELKVLDSDEEFISTKHQSISMWKYQTFETISHFIYLQLYSNTVSKYNCTSVILIKSHKYVPTIEFYLVGIWFLIYSYRISGVSSFDVGVLKLIWTYMSSKKITSQGLTFLVIFIFRRYSNKSSQSKSCMHAYIMHNRVSNRGVFSGSSHL